MKIRTEKLGELCNVLAGGTPSRSNPSFWNGGIPWVKISDMLQGRIQFTEETISKEGLENSTARLLPRGTLLLSIFATIGRTAVLGIEATTNQAIVGLVPRRSDTVDVAYLRRYLETQVSVLARKGRGGAQPNINGSILKDLDVPLPPLVDQKRIAAVLGKADALRRQRQESLRLIENLLQSVFVDIFGDLAKQPSRKLVDLLNRPLRNGVSPASAGTYAGTVLTLSAITQGSFDSGARKEAMFATTPKPAAHIEPEDFLICRGNGNLKLCGRGQFPTDDAIGIIFPDTMIAASLDLTQVSRGYFATLWNQPFVRTQLEAAARTANGTYKVNQTALENTTIPIPKIDRRIEFERIAKLMVAVRSDLEVSSEYFDALFSSIQQRAFRGGLDLSRLLLDPPLDSPPTHEPEAPMNKAAGPGLSAISLQAPPATEAALKELDVIVAKGEPIPWSADFFKYRILGKHPTPFSFADLIQVAEPVFDEPPPYEEIVDMVLDLLGQGGVRPLMGQSFDLNIDANTQEISGRREIVFGPAA